LQKPPANHTCNCKICRHPERQSIETLFMESCSPDWIAEYFGLSNRQMVYRHATAAGLYKRRPALSSASGKDCSKRGA
jgi:hypothetical protein